MDSSAPLLLAGVGSAFVAGATGSLHCALMCGPLACAGLPKDAPRWRSIASWNVGRVAAYASVGAGLGALGHGASLALSHRVEPYLPWLLALGLVATALEWGKYVKPLPGVRHVSVALAALGRRFSPLGRAAALGAATPFLPCGLLYGLFLAALATGSAWGGAAVLGTFAVGAVPALVIAQLGARRALQNARFGMLLRRGVPLVAAMVLVWRALQVKSGTPECH